MPLKNALLMASGGTTTLKILQPQTVRIECESEGSIGLQLYLNNNPFKKYDDPELPDAGQRGFDLYIPRAGALRIRNISLHSLRITIYY